MDYFTYNRRRGNSNASGERPNTTGAQVPPQTPGPNPGLRPPRPGGSLEGLRAPSSIRIRRLPSGAATPRPVTNSADEGSPSGLATTGRRRSSSEPHQYGQNLAPPRTDLTRQRTADGAHMATVAEEGGATPGGQPLPTATPQEFYEAPETPPVGEGDSINGDPARRVLTSASAMHSAGNAARTNRGLQRSRTGASMRSRNEQPASDEYHSDVVDLLDLVDPEVQTLGTLTNVQNSLFVPDLGRLLNRRPTYNLSARPSTQENVARIGRLRDRTATHAAQSTDLDTIPQESQEEQKQELDGDIEMQPRPRRFSISSNLSDSRYAVLPHGISLDDWSEEDKAELDDYVRHLMHSRKEGLKRTWKGFKQYVSKPLGLFVFVYAVLVTLFGATWVFFLIGWISVGGKQGYATNVVDLILVALFALMGDGLAPFRAVDTYHMCFIARYHHLTWRLRKERGLTELVDHNDLPTRRASAAELEDAIDKEESAEFSVLKPIQQRRLQYHQAKFSKAHTFYRPHETPTHHAFPLNLLVAIVVLLDFHSCFQVALGTCTWSWSDYHTRPEALTATILACSLSCNITAGILISVGDHRTRKKDVLERIERQNLTQEALERMAQKRQSEERIANKSVEVSRAVQERDNKVAQAEEQTAGPSLVVQTPTNTSSHVKSEEKRE